MQKLKVIKKTEISYGVYKYLYRYNNKYYVHVSYFPYKTFKDLKEAYEPFDSGNKKEMENIFKKI